MQFENRSPDEGINAQPEHLGREAIWLIVGAIVCVIGLVVLADVAASWLAPRLPFSLERELADRMEGEPPKLPPQEQAANAALQELADRLRGPLGMPEDITVKVRVDDSEVLNAYATVGGRIVIHRGLLRRLRGEHELAALLAHEMAHVQHRHVAASLGPGPAQSPPPPPLPPHPIHPAIRASPLAPCPPGSAPPPPTKTAARRPAPGPARTACP